MKKLIVVVCGLLLTGTVMANIVIIQTPDGQKSCIVSQGVITCL